MESSSTGPSPLTSIVFDSLGTNEVQEIQIGALKWRFFELGLRAGVAFQMLFTCVLLMLTDSDAVHEISSLYYPLFRGCFLLSFFGVLFAMLLFAWKRTGVDYGAIFGVSPYRTNYHAIVRASFTLMSLNTLAFVVFWLTLTVDLSSDVHGFINGEKIVTKRRSLKHIGPLAAFGGTMLLLVAPIDWMPAWHDAAQRAALARTAGRALLAPFTASTFASSFVADVFTSMPKCFIDLLFATCIYASGEAVTVGHWHHYQDTFDRPLTICTEDNPTYHRVFVLLSILPFCMRLMQCVRQVSEAICGGTAGWRQPLANALKYIMSLLVIILSIIGGRTEAWPRHGPKPWTRTVDCRPWTLDAGPWTLGLGTWGSAEDAFDLGPGFQRLPSTLLVLPSSHPHPHP
mmetsp:Transcript_77632/g.154205  ORF Transcript_77632/g.154205 Transcript_77632/m.154205 type:complete len:401 (-) Transcript_77632:40-1242(-)